MSAREARRAEARWLRRFKPMRPIRRWGERFFGAARLGVAQTTPADWPEPLPEGKAIRYRSRIVPAIPGRTLYDGTVIKPRPAERVKYPELVNEADTLPPPTGRKAPRGWTGWKLALFMGLTFGGLALGMGFLSPDKGSATALVNLPFVDLTNPAYGINNTGTDTYTTLQAVFTNNGAATYYGGYASIYTSSKPILYTDGTWVVGAGTNRRQTTSGTTFKIASGATTADWAGQGYFTSTGFANDTQITGLGEVCGFRDFLIDCNGQSYGNGILTAGIAQPHFINLRWENYLGNQGMPTRGSGVNKNFGQGFGICLTIYTIAGNSAASSTNPNDPLIWNCRQTPKTVGPNNNTGTFSSSPLVWTDDDGSSSITDGIMIWCQPEGGSARAGTDISNQAGISQGIIDIQHAGGWHLDFVHLNGPGGQGIVLRNAMSTHVFNGWLDGWGTAAVNGTTYDQIQVTMTSGGGSGIGPISLWGNTFRYRDEQTNGGGTVTYRALNISAASNNTELNFYGNNGFIQSNLATGTMRVFNIGGTGTTSLANIYGNNFITDTAATFDGVQIFAAIASGWTVRNGGNSWDYSSTPAATAGTWPVSYRRWNSAPATGAVDYAVCTTAGTPGTWYSRYIPATSSGVGVYFPFVNAGTTAIVPTALTVYLWPIWVPELIPTVTGIGWMASVNTTGGNVGVALYDNTGTLIVQSAGTLAFPSSVSVATAFTAAQTNLVPGKYFLAFCAQSGTLNSARGNGNSGRNAAFTAVTLATAPGNVVTFPATTGGLASSTDSFNMALY